MGVVPELIDNKRVTEHTLGEVLKALLLGTENAEFWVATAYFNLGGWIHLSDALHRTAKIRLLLGKEQEQAFVVDERLRSELQEEVKNRGAEAMVEIADWEHLLRSDKVEVRVYKKGFLHGKCYLVLGGGVGQDAGIVGSSNFTGAGLEQNLELNATIRNEYPLEHLKKWFETLWDESEDYKHRLLSLLTDFTRRYTPYEIYIKVAYEAYRDRLQTQLAETPEKPSAIALANFQEDGRRIAQRVLERYGGVLICDSVGLGKTYVALALLDEYCYHRRQPALVICPAALGYPMWERVLQAHAIPYKILSMENLSRLSDDELLPYAKYPVVLVDESHNFRNPNSNRWANLLRILQIAVSQGRSPLVILLSATPVNNSIFDLLHQLRLITRDDPAFFSDIGINDLTRYFQAAERNQDALYELLDAIVVRRSRSFIRRNYPDAGIGGEKIKRRLKNSLQ